MATELSNHLGKLAQLSMKSKTQEIYMAQQAAAENMTMERFLEGIHVFRCHDQNELLASIHHLPAFLQLKTKVKLIIIDSIAFHFRQDVNDIGLRNRLLSSIIQTFNQLAFDHRLAVVFINHVTTKFVKDRSISMNASRLDTDGNRGITLSVIVLLSLMEYDLVLYFFLDSSSGYGSNQQRIVPALGEQWSHSITNRIMLNWSTGPSLISSTSSSSSSTARIATLVKSPALPPNAAEFAVNKKGIRDAPTTTSNITNLPTVSTYSLLLITTFNWMLFLLQTAGEKRPRETT
jgi:hypothetical protein